MNNVINEILAMKVMGYKDACGFNPMEKMNDTWEMVEKLRDLNVEILVRHWGRDRGEESDGYFANAHKNTKSRVNYYTVAPTASVAICLSTCRALGIDVDIYNQSEDMKLWSREVTMP